MTDCDVCHSGPADHLITLHESAATIDPGDAQSLAVLEELHVCADCWPGIRILYVPQPNVEQTRSRSGPVMVLQRVVDLVDHFHQHILPFYTSLREDRFLPRPVGLFFDSLREDRFFLVSYLVGSYLIFQTVFNDLTGRYPLCTSSSTCSFPSASVLLFGIILLVLATFKRLTDLEAEKRNPLARTSSASRTLSQLILTIEEIPLSSLSAPRRSQKIAVFRRGCISC